MKKRHDDFNEIDWQLVGLIAGIVLAIVLFIVFWGM